MLRRITNESDYADISDTEVEGWLVQAKEGDEQALNQLRCWAYFTALRYLDIRARGERLLSTYDVEEMASNFFVEFDSSWRKIRSATHYTRFLLASWIARYSKRRRVVEEREVSFERARPVVARNAPNPWRDWDDERWTRFQAMLVTFQEQDPCTQAVVQARLTAPPVTYRSLSIRLDSTETALRMRMTRFQKAVRKNYNRIRRESLPRLNGKPELDSMEADDEQSST